MAISSTRPKENAPHEAGHYLSLVARGGIEPPTQEFSNPLIDRFRLDFKSLSHRFELVKKLCVLVPVKFGNEIRILRGAIFLCAEIAY